MLRDFNKYPRKPGETPLYQFCGEGSTTPAPELLMEYVPNAEFEFWLKGVSQNVILCFVSCVGLMILCQGFPFLQDLLYAFFRWVLIPVKPLLVSTPPASVSGIIALLSPISTIANLLAIPLIIYLAIRGQRLNTYLAVDKATRRLLLVRHFFSGEKTDREIAWINDGRFTVLKTLPLAQLQDFSLNRKAGKKSVLDYEIIVNTPPGVLDTVFDRRIKSIRWGDILKAEDREKFLQFLEAEYPGRIDSSLLEPFRALPERQSYTELWLKELSGAPKRDKLTPLQENSCLHNDCYKIVRKIGVGGQGSVYLATSRKHPDKEFVILKEFMLPVYPDIRVRKKAAERFQTEASMLSKLQHPQIAAFLDLFLEDHRSYLVMEHVDGITLKELVAREGTQPESQAIELFKQLAEILCYLHSQTPPVIHRDLTPDNIMLCDGSVKLIDFSVAQEISSGVTGSVVGKPNYISPEQFRGKACTQSDIYSLGATIYYLLTGHDPPPITVLHPAREQASINSELDRIIACCTRLELSDRYKKAEDLLADLNRLQKS